MVYPVKKKMIPEKWTVVDEFFEKTFLEEDAVLKAVLQRSEAAGLPPHSISPCQAQLLALLVLISESRRVLELGTLGGYSTLWMARVIPADGTLVTIESNSIHAAVARQSFAEAGLGGKIVLVEGDATDALQRLAEKSVEPFDFVFIDADKPSNPQYLELVLELVRSGAVIVGDNVVRDGDIATTTSVDPKVIGVRQYCQDLTTRGLLSTGIQTVGRKGYDGFSISYVP